MTIKKSLSLIVVLALSIAGAALVTLIKANFPFAHTDLFAYWSGFQVIVQGGNPYDPHTILEFQKMYAPERTIPAMSWNPPFLFIFAAPLFSLPAELFRFIVRTLTFLSIFGLTEFFIKPRKLRDFLIVSTTLFLFLPIFMELYIEQFTAILVLLFVAAIYFIHTRKDILAGACLAILTLKPHIAFIPLLYVGLWVLVVRRWRILISGAASLAALMLFAEILFPLTIQNWLFRVSWPQEYLGANTWSILRDTIMLTQSEWLVIRGLFLVLAGGICIYFLALKNKDVISWKRIGTLCVCNFLVVPYGFMFDQLLLLIPFLLILKIFLDGNEFAVTMRAVFMFYIAVQSSILLLFYNATLPYSSLPVVWFSTAWILTLMWYLSMKNFPEMKNSAQDDQK